MTSSSSRTAATILKFWVLFIAQVVVFVPRLLILFEQTQITKTKQKQSLEKLEADKGN